MRTEPRPCWLERYAARCGRKGPSTGAQFSKAAAKKLLSRLGSKCTPQARPAVVVSSALSEGLLAQAVRGVRTIPEDGQRGAVPAGSEPQDGAQRRACFASCNSRTSPATATNSGADTAHTFEPRSERRTEELFASPLPLPPSAALLTFKHTFS